MKEGWKGKERRRFPRINGKIPVKYRRISDLSSLDFEALEHKVAQDYTKDFSGNGVCIKTGERIAPDTTLELTIEFPDRHIKVVGKVIWSKELEKPGEFYAGVKYVAIADNQATAMTQSIAEFLIESYKLKEKEGISKLKEILSHLFSNEE